VPRFLTLRGGHLHQDIVGVPSAVRSYTDRAAVFTAQLDVSRGAVTVSLLDEEDGLLATVRHSGDRIEVTRPTRDGVGDVRTAELADGDSDTLTILVDGPVCEVFADGGLVSLTSSLLGDAPFAKFRVDTTAGSRVLSAMESLGRRLQRRLAQLDNPEEQERLIAEAALADRDLAADD
jgi:beta-fructofuranosidase